MNDTCTCGLADECDGQHAILYPLQDGGMCSVRACYKPKQYQNEEYLPDSMDYSNE